MKYDVEFKVEYIPCPPEHVAVYWEGVRTLYSLLWMLAEEERKRKAASLPAGDGLEAQP